MGWGGWEDTNKESAQSGVSFSIVFPELNLLGSQLAKDSGKAGD